MADSDYVVFFNQNEEARKKAKDDFIKKYDIITFNNEIQPYINKGIMSIFDEKPNKYIKYYFFSVVNHQRALSKAEDNFHKTVKVDSSNFSQADSIQRLRKVGVKEEIKKFDRLYAYLKMKGFKPRIKKVHKVTNFYSVVISLPYTHKQLHTDQQFFFSKGFTSATYHSNEKIELGIYVHEVE